MKVGIYGFGFIGRFIAKVAIERGHEIVGVVDIDPSLIGKDVGEVLGIDKLGITVSKDPEVLKGSEVILHATKSYLDEVYPQLVNSMRLGADVVSTCETLAYPYYRYPVLARKIDELARNYGVAIIGTGINPGFLLDTLVITLSASVNVVKRVKAVRSLDAAKRRLSFRKKIGVGEDPKIVKEKLIKGEITGHVGYAESVFLIADAAGIHLTRIKEGQDVVVAEEDVESCGIRVRKGLNRGITGYGVGYVGNKEVIRLELHAYVGAKEYEEILIEGKDYSITWRSTGTPGDLGTASVILSIAEKIGEYRPGLLLMTDIIPFKLKFTY